MTFLEAIEEMKKGKTVGNTEYPKQLYKIVNGVIENYNNTTPCIASREVESTDWFIINKTKRKYHHIFYIQDEYKMYKKHDIISDKKLEDLIICKEIKEDVFYKEDEINIDISLEDFKIMYKLN